MEVTILNEQGTGFYLSLPNFNYLDNKGVFDKVNQGKGHTIFKTTKCVQLSNNIYEVATNQVLESLANFVSKSQSIKIML